MVNWQILGQMVTAALILVAGPLVIFIAKKS
nr:hypothetical protein V2496_pgp098 [Sporochnus bolleanus]WAM64850.1 hypothetical protein [Sporochnus bolleanus]